MRHFIALSFLLLCLSSTCVFAADSTDLERQAGQAECQDSLKICSYLAQNLNAQTLIARILPVMFPDMPLDPREGFVQRENLKKIIFWFNNEEMRQRFSSLLPHFDLLEDFVPTSMVNLTTEVYAVTDEALTEISATLGMGASVGLPSPTTAPATDTPAGLNLSAGFSYGVANFSLSMALTAQRVLNRVSRVTSVQQVVPNFTNINYKHTTTIFMSPTPGTAKEQDAGLTISGTVSVNRHNQEQILLKDFNLYYGVELPQASNDAVPRVAALQINNPELYLLEGSSSVVVSANTFELRNNRGLGLPTRISRGTISTKLMVVVRAKALSFDEFLRSNREMRAMENQVHFTQAELDKFPTDTIPLDILMQAIRPFARLSLSGDRLLGIRMDRQYARKDNYKKNLEITIHAKGFKQTAVRTVENLMLTGLKFEDLPRRVLQKATVKITIKARPFKKLTLRRPKKVLYYNPATHEFLVP
ncbi:MAG: hypothetical protein A2X86_13255 [Bdellovibrionales bacterium GWA2_49_15]|nr:MAG: hypothetical protein A2X86_13255 [Bdellovibrionales bacterium GWA2_49_15]HAZ13492.1 hypothetical protein [Bdellovibrionales bacterium]